MRALHDSIYQLCQTLLCACVCVWMQLNNKIKLQLNEKTWLMWVYAVLSFDLICYCSIATFEVFKREWFFPLRSRQLLMKVFFSPTLIKIISIDLFRGVTWTHIGHHFTHWNLLSVMMVFDVAVAVAVAIIVLLSRSVDEWKYHSKKELTLLLLTGENECECVCACDNGWLICDFLFAF